MAASTRCPQPGTPEHAAAEDRLNDVLADVLLRLGDQAPPLPATGTDPSP